MRYVIFTMRAGLLLLAFSAVAVAQTPAETAKAFVAQCQADAQSLSPAPVVFAFEGFGGFDGAGLRRLKGVLAGAASIYDIFSNDSRSGHLLHGLLEPIYIKKQLTQWYYFPDDAIDGVTETPAYLCAKAWVTSESSTKNRITLLGYSYGAQAVTQLAAQLGDQAPIEYVVTIDPVRKFFKGDFPRSKNMQRWVNFFETNAFFPHGASLPQADINRDLSASRYGHQTIPYAQEILDQVEADLAK